MDEALSDVRHRLGEKRRRRDVAGDLLRLAEVVEIVTARPADREREGIRLATTARAANTLLSMIWRLTETGDDAPELDDPLLDDELAIVKAYEDRVRRDTHDDAPNTLQDEEETSK